MKKMKRIFALLIAMVMVLGMSTSVFAAGEGTITIKAPEITLPLSTTPGPSSLRRGSEHPHS